MSDPDRPSRRRRAPRARLERNERGAGLLSTTIGVAVMLTMLGFAANVTLGLWTRSTVDAVAYDAARRVATSAAPTSDPTATHGVEQAAIAQARDTLGPFGDELELDFEHAPGGDLVVLHVRAPGVALLPRLLHGGAIVGAVDRRIVMRREGLG